MYEQYWKMLTEKKYHEWYFWEYNIRNTQLLTAINIMLVAANVFNLVYAFAIAELSNVGIVIHIGIAVLCQTAILCLPLSQRFERKIALKFLIPKLIQNFEMIKGVP